MVGHFVICGILLLLHVSSSQDQFGRHRGNRGHHHGHRPIGGPPGQSFQPGNRPNHHRCKGNMKNHADCRPHTSHYEKHGGGGVGGGGGAGGGVVGGVGGGEMNKIFDIPWMPALTTDNQSIALPGLPETPTQHSEEARFYVLANGVGDVPYQPCLTPRYARGHCRFLEFCILPAFINNYEVFLEYLCFIGGEYVGVCCPDSRYPNIVTTKAPPTTPATTTKRPPTPPNSIGCGISSIPQTRIVGGRDVAINKFPWAAALLRSTSTQFCGGVLITDKHVLTAAHCVDGIDAATITVRLGEYSFNTEVNATHKDFKLASAVMHEQYNTSTFVNDVAILTLLRSTDLSKNIWPVCLPPPKVEFTGEMATVIGWGTIYYGGPVAKTLQEVTIPIWTNADCDAAYKGNKVFSQNLCAGDKMGGKDSCQGDSGGPLMLEYGPERRWTVIGVVSWGIRCADPGIPGVYARVSNLVDWIKKKTT